MLRRLIGTLLRVVIRIKMPNSILDLGMVGQVRDLEIVDSVAFYVRARVAVISVGARCGMFDL